MYFRKTNYSGYFIENRDAVLAALSEQGFVPAYKNVIMEHITYKYPDKGEAPKAHEVLIVGHVERNGVQTLVVSVDGVLTRPTGGIFHITYSLADGHKPVESNKLIESVGVNNTTRLATPIKLKVTPF